MARRKSMYRRRPRKSVFKRRFRRRGGVKIKSALQPIPARQIVKMKYCQNVQTSVATAYNWQFNLNSIFDPDRTGTGHQPYGHDTLATLYNRYRVIACSYVVQAYSSTTGFRYAVVPANESKVFTTVAEMSENPRAQYKVGSPGTSIPKIRGKVYLPALTGRSKSQYMADDRYQAVFGTNPQELAVLNMVALDLAEAGTTINWVVTLEYTVEVFDVNPLGQS